MEQDYEDSSDDSERTISAFQLQDLNMSRDQDDLLLPQLPAKKWASIAAIKTETPNPSRYSNPVPPAFYPFSSMAFESIVGNVHNNAGSASTSNSLPDVVYFNEQPPVAYGQQIIPVYHQYFSPPSNYYSPIFIQRGAAACQRVPYGFGYSAAVDSGLGTFNQSMGGTVVYPPLLQHSPFQDNSGMGATYNHHSPPKNRVVAGSLNGEYLPQAMTAREASIISTVNDVVLHVTGRRNAPTHFQQPIRSKEHSKVSCDDCGKCMLSRSITRHKKYSCKMRVVQQQKEKMPRRMNWGAHAEIVKHENADHSLITEASIFKLRDANEQLVNFEHGDINKL